MRQVIIFPKEDGLWVAECPSLQGCVAQGRSRAAVLCSIRELIDSRVKDLEEAGQKVPEDPFEAVLVAL